jgi:enoyl-CoA hydratase/carnithine racemase
MRSYAQLLDSTSDNIASMYDAKAGGGTEHWRDYMKTESWFGADEAVELGLADSVNVAKADDTEAEPAARMKFDTETLFSYAGRSKAPAPAPLPTANTETSGGVSRNYTLRHRHNARKLGLSA